MTIGEYVESRGLALRYFAIALIAVTLLLAVFVFPERFDQITSWQQALCFVPVLALYAIFSVTTNCPRCHASLGDSINAVAIPFSSTRPDRCPRCDVSFDEPMDSPDRKA
jgi:hypothetical protein